MRKTFFWIAAVLHPTAEEMRLGTKSSETILKPEAVLAVNAQAATLMAARKLPEKYQEVLDRVDIAVSPF